MNTRTYDPIRRLLLAAAALVLLGLCAGPTPAMERNAFTMEILVDGRPLQEHVARGTTYVEALAGREYAVRLRNRTGERVAIALSVDGLNSIDAKTTTAREASKWILGPYETTTIGGWQTSSSSARKFFFTTEERSYGAWLGKTKNLGVVTAAVFRENRPRPVPILREDSRRWSHPSPAKEGAAGEPMTPVPADAKGEAAGVELKSRDAAADRGIRQEAELDDDLAATGIGRKYGHSVRTVRFNAERSPAAVMEVRYEYHDALVRLGVLPAPYICDDDPLTRRERAGGFDDLRFAPDPY